MPGCKALDGPATNPENSACRGRMERRAKCPHGKERDWRTPIPSFAPVRPKGRAGTYCFPTILLALILVVINQEPKLRMSMTMRTRMKKAVAKKSATALKWPGIFSRKLPGRAIFAGQQFAGFLVMKNLLILDIPINFAPDEHGNQTQMTRNRRVMGGFHGRNRRLT